MIIEWKGDEIEGTQRQDPGGTGLRPADHGPGLPHVPDPLV